MALGAGTALAQPVTEGRRIYDEQLRVRLDQQQVTARELGLDAGGWFSFALFAYDDAQAKRDRTLRQYDLRAWASLTIEGVHSFYVRGLTGYDDWNTGDNPAGHGDDYRDPDIERAWYRYDYNRHVRNRTGQAPPVGFTIQVGRDYYELGSGLVLAMPLDAVDFTVSLGDLELRGLLGMTIRDTASIDESEPVADHQERCFYGVQARYNGLSRHRPYVYYLWQFDHTDPWPDDPYQGFQYDSRYLGAGSTGSILLANLRYTTELSWESGRSFGEGQKRHRDEIHALALDVLLEYLFDVPRHPKVLFEYLWGSGDANRRASSTSTIGGNLAGTRDEAFNAFGFRDTGLALAPRIANLHIFQIGASAFPLEEVDLFRKMEVGTSVYFYDKDAASGAISDVNARRDSDWAGWEWDVYLNWRLTSDLALTLRYGVFDPGAAFLDKERRHFLYTGVTYSF